MSRRIKSDGSSVEILLWIFHWVECVEEILPELDLKDV